MSILVKKRTLLVILFTFLLLVSIFFMFADKAPKALKKVENDGIKKVSSSTEIKSLSVDKGLNKENDFFIDYKLERDRLRSQEADYLREIINNPNASQQSKDKAQQDLINLSHKVEREMIVENLVKAKGFEDAVLFLSENNANIVVKTDGLLDKEVVQISEVITKTTNVPIEKITIIERK